ncbi:efflux RND transporter periplasmic adaptor subunit [Sulfurimonas sp. SAG-AH-194-I05]|nr:efflux RND transporter periplasmic adaptor subunit [Sulfurimonas sp. SAG-AH-194-I05]MDF1874257.1 efflux RND transporter periplasmic adaptor subunit [Sulfurimonas sp. SAG-AH-194-I05]
MKYLILLTLLLSLSEAKEATVVQLFSVQTLKVAQSSHSKQMKSFGFVTIDDSLVYDVSPRFGGYIEVLYANKLYKKVTKGQALARVYSPEVLKAKDEYINSLRYSKNKAMSKSALTKLKLLKIPHAEIKNIQKDRTLTTLIAPSSGYIFKKNINNKAAFNAKQTLFEIVNLKNVWVEVKIHQNQRELLRSIKTFTLTTPSSKEIFTASNAGIYPTLDAKEESYTLRLEVKNKNLYLKPGMYMRVAMKQAPQNYLTLPTTAVIRKNGVFYVFVVGEYEGEYEPLQIEVEVLNPDTYIVKSGLMAGDEVVNNALFMMDSDAQVNGLY